MQGISTGGPNNTDYDTRVLSWAIGENIDRSIGKRRPGERTLLSRRQLHTLVFSPGLLFCLKGWDESVGFFYRINLPIRDSLGC